MKIYSGKVIAGLKAVFDLCRARGVLAGVMELRGKLWRRSCSILYVKCGGELVVPESIRIVKVTTAESQAALPDILAAGAGGDIRFFDSGALCYLAYQNNRPVGLGWLFRDSYFLKTVLPHIPSSPLVGEGRGEGVYLAGFHVIDSARGQGVYPLLLNVMSRDAADQGKASYVDVDPGNQASIRGIEKAGFTCLGFLHVTVVSGLIVRARIEPHFARPGRSFGIVVGC